MRIILSYPSEYDKGEGIHYSRVLQRLGHDVCEVNVAATPLTVGSPGRTIKGYPPEVELEELIDEFGNVDLFLYIEPWSLIPRGLERSPIPTACILSDVHRNLKARQTLARLFDYVFVRQLDYMTKFSEHGEGAAHWHPWYCDAKFFTDLGLNRDLDIACVSQLYGRRNPRMQALATLSERHRVNEQRYYLQKEIPEIYSRAKIVLNIPVSHELNPRFFEAILCGALLLTERIGNGQEDLLTENVHYVAFGSEEEMYEKVEFYLRNDEERKRIARAGHQEVVAHHNLAHGVETLLRKINGKGILSAPVRKMKRDEVVGLYAAVYERSGRVDMLLRLSAEQKPYSMARFRTLGMGFKSFLRRAVLNW